MLTLSKYSKIVSISNFGPLSSFARLFSSPELTTGTAEKKERTAKVHPSLIPIVGQERIGWKDALKKTWDYIRVNSLQDSEVKTKINLDNALATAFGKSTVSQVEIFKLLRPLLIFDPLPPKAPRKPKSNADSEAPKKPRAKKAKKVDNNESQEPKKRTKKSTEKVSKKSKKEVAEPEPAVVKKRAPRTKKQPVEDVSLKDI